MPKIEGSSPVAGAYAEDLRGKEGENKNPWAMLEELAGDMPAYTVGDDGMYYYRQGAAMTRFQQLTKEAEANGDNARADYYKNWMRQTLQDNPISISNEDFNRLSNEGKMRFYELSGRQAQINGDKEAAKEWHRRYDALEKNKEQSFESMSSGDQIDRIISKIVKETNQEPYPENKKESLSDKTKKIISGSLKDAVNTCTDSFKEYVKTRKGSYASRAKSFYGEMMQHTRGLFESGAVSEDVVKVWLHPEAIMNQLDIFNNYNDLQNVHYQDNLKKGEQNNLKYLDVLKHLAESSNDARWQSKKDPNNEAEDLSYNPNEGMRYDFLHFNSQQPTAENPNMRCYISPNYDSNPAEVLSCWAQTIENSPLKDKLYYKIDTYVNDRAPIDRSDKIVIYKTEGIPDDEFSAVLLDFQDRCNRESPDLLENNDQRLPTAAQKIAKGISIAPEPQYLNHYLRYTGHGHGEEKHSWTTFVDRIMTLSASIVANRKGSDYGGPKDPSTLNEIKKVFAEFMKLAKIDPNTMLPEELSSNLPLWVRKVSSHNT